MYCIFFFNLTGYYHGYLVRVHTIYITITLNPIYSLTIDWTLSVLCVDGHAWRSLYPVWYVSTFILLIILHYNYYIYTHTQTLSYVEKMKEKDSFFFINHWLCWCASFFPIQSQSQILRKFECLLFSIIIWFC